MTIEADQFLADVHRELFVAQSKHPALHSAHEGLGVLMEEVREFEQEVFKRRAERDPDAMREELVQIAAVCARCVIELDMRVGA